MASASHRTAAVSPSRSLVATAWRKARTEHLSRLAELPDFAPVAHARIGQLAMLERMLMMRRSGRLRGYAANMLFWELARERPLDTVVMGLELARGRGLTSREIEVLRLDVDQSGLARLH